MDRRHNVNDFLSENIMPLLRNIDDLAEEMHNVLSGDAEEGFNLYLIRDNIEIIKELIGVYR